MNINVRLDSVEIKNLKNISYGKIELHGADSLKANRPDILGIYGQNGSGKTAFINSLAILKRILMGQQIPREAVNFISLKADSCTLRFVFALFDGENNAYSVSYRCVLKSADSPDQGNDNAMLLQKVIVVDHEVLTFGGIVDGKKRNEQILAESGDEETPIIPRSKLKALVGGKTGSINDLIVSKKLSYRNSQSFLFSPEIQKLIHGKNKDRSLVNVFDALTNYGNQYLFIVNTRDSGLISLNFALPFSFRIQDKKQLSFGSLPIRLDSPTVIPQKAFDLLSAIIDNMNTVLEQLIPHLKVGVENLGTQLLDNGEKGVTVQLTSIRDDIVLPLKNESEGIKKIIAVLQLLIATYNHESMTVAIDELDSGVFEYLLGEILKILSESGKGQLVFTSHNLRPLETLDDKFICFTTTNPDNRFVRIEGVQKNNNLRSLYYRSILLGGQNEKLYDPTNNYKIVLAFKMAGDRDDA